MRKLIGAVLLVCLLSGEFLFAQNFFWSLNGFEDGAVNQSLTINTNTNAAGKVFLYYADNGQDISDGIQLDFSWDRNGVVGFTAAETFEADLSLGIACVSDRWVDHFGAASEINSEFVNNFLAVNVVGGSGILTTNIPGVVDSNGLDFIDLLYDTTAEAFLVGSIDFESLGVGTAALQVDGLVVDDGVALDVPFTP